MQYIEKTKKYEKNIGITQVIYGNESPDNKWRITPRI
jgi:hypothetical protein